MESEIQKYEIRWSLPLMCAYMLTCWGESLSTLVENLRQISSFIPNKPNFPHFLLENDDSTKKQTQFKPIQNQFWPKNQGGKANSNPNKPNTKPISPSISVPATLMIDYYLQPAYNDAQNFERSNYGFRAKQ